MELSREAKETALRNAITNMSAEIYSLCLQVGIDPDIIEVDDPEASFPTNVTEADPNFYVFQRLSRACSALVLANEKLAQLESQG